jgi:hypothetical protein
MADGSGTELQVDHLYKITADNYGGRKYLIHEIDGDRVFATEGWFSYMLDPKHPSPEDAWEWSSEGAKWYERSHFAWCRDVGRVPEVGEPRFRFRWGTDAG